MLMKLHVFFSTYSYVIIVINTDMKSLPFLFAIGNYIAMHVKEYIYVSGSGEGRYNEEINFLV